MNDETESYRRARMAELGQLTQAQEDELMLIRGLEAQYGKVWDTQGLGAEFKVLGFLAPLVVVQRKADGKKGSLEFTHSPRLYFNWIED